MDEQSRWTLWRQDDNGSSAIIEASLSQQDAKARQKELEDRGHKQLYWIEPDTSKVRPALNLVVIRAKDIEASKAFYKTLGLTFERHQHGKGLPHYTYETNSCVFEIYPAQDESSSTLRMGFSVADPDHLVELLINSGNKILTAPKDSPWGRRAVVQDPDGHKVELTKLK